MLTSRVFPFSVQLAIVCIEGRTEDGRLEVGRLAADCSFDRRSPSSTGLLTPADAPGPVRESDEQPDVDESEPSSRSQASSVAGPCGTGAAVTGESRPITSAIATTDAKDVR